MFFFFIVVFRSFVFFFLFCSFDMENAEYLIEIGLDYSICIIQQWEFCNLFCCCFVPIPIWECVCVLVFSCKNYRLHVNFLLHILFSFSHYGCNWNSRKLHYRRIDRMRRGIEGRDVRQCTCGNCVCIGGFSLSNWTLNHDLNLFRSKQNFIP